MTYRAYLDQEFTRRKGLNRSYSLRAFARDLGIQPSHLADLFKNKKGLSAKKAEDICLRLHWQGAERDEFVNLVESEHARSRTVREKAARNLRARRTAFDEMSLEQFRKVSSWLALAILELVDIPGVDVSVAGMAERFGTLPKAIEEALEALVDVGYLRKIADGFRPSAIHQATPKVASSQVIRDFHHAVLQQAREKLEAIPADQREFSSLVFSVDPKRMEEAKKWLRDSRREFATTFASKESGSQVFCLATQFFSLEAASEFDVTEIKP